MSLQPGASFFDSVESFEIVRSGKLDAVVLGAFQVDSFGNLANWSSPNMVGGGIGGAMDLIESGARIIVTMNHLDSEGGPKLVDRCSYPLTGLGCVDTVVTDLCLLGRHDGRFVLEELAPGFTLDEVLDLTGFQVAVSDDVRPLGQRA